MGGEAQVSRRPADTDLRRHERRRPGERVSGDCQIDLFGGLRVTQGERVITRFRTTKTAALLAYLAGEVGRPRPRDELIEQLWPEAEPAAGRNSLSVALSSLRSQLEPPGSGACILTADRHTVGLNQPAVDVDLDRFRRWLRLAREAGGGDRLEALRGAVECYRGELLPEFYDDWAVALRRQCAGEYAAAAAALVAELSDRGDTAGALHWATQAAERAPLDEALCAAELRLLLDAGRAGEARARYDSFLERLANDVGLPPSEALEALGDALAAEPAAEAPEPPPEVSPRRGGIVTYWLLAQADDSPVEAIERRLREHGGTIIEAVAGSVAAVFDRPSEALACAAAVQRERAEAPDRPRLALHTAELADAEGFCGSALQAARRLVGAAHPGQTVLTETCAALLRCGLEPGLWLVELGAWRLDGAQRPETLYQLDYPELDPHRFSPLRAEVGYAARLPLQLTRFIGRAAELSRIDELLLDERARLVTITGPGGTGKTRLSLEAARRLVQPFAGAVWFVPLAEVREAERLIDALREALGIPSVPGCDPWAAVAELLGRQAGLLVLDNFEQLVEPGAPVVQRLLEQLPGLCCLVSSRQPLRLGAERELPLPPLPLPEPGLSLEQLARCESIALFCDRAAAARPDFHLSEANRAPLTELCARLDGMPLAIELAAARASVLTPAQILERLARPFELLASRRRDLPDRHKTLRAAIDWSHELLDTGQQTFFRRLAIFRGGFTLDDAEVVCDEPLALDRLAELSDCSLLCVDSGPSMRYRLLDVIRLYAADRLAESGEGEVLAERHFERFAGLAAEADRELEQHEDEGLLRRLDAEQDNFAAALEWARDQRPEAALELACSHWRYRLVRGWWRQARDDLEATLAAAGEVRVDLRLRVFGRLGHLSYRLGDYERAGELAAESLELSRALDDSRGVATALNELGKVAWARGEFAAARELYEQSLALRRADQNAWSLAAVLSNLGTVAAAQGDDEAARVYLEEGLALRRELGDLRGVAGSLGNLGVLARGRGDLELAGRLQDESLALRRQLGDTAGIAAALSDLGVLAAERGDYAAATAYHGEALERRRQIGDQRGVASSLNNLGVVAMSRGDWATARRLYDESLDIRRAIGDQRGLALALNNVGDLALSRGDLAAAGSLFEQALAVQREIGDAHGLALTLANLGEVARGDGDLALARSWFEQCLAAANGTGARWLRGHALKGLADVARAEAEFAAGRELLGRSLREHRECDNLPGIAQALDGAALLEWADQRPAPAARLAGCAEALRERLAVTLTPAEQAEQRALLEALRAALGEQFGEAWDEGRERPWELAVEELAAALASLPGD